jgi:radical SAM protein with 4Fe4S-binding SPASM domain
MTALPETDLYQAPELARLVVSTYDLLLNRNPVADEFYAHMQALADGMREEQLFQQIAGSPEAAARFLKNPNFNTLANNLLGMDGQPATIPAPISRFAWKAENRALISYDPVSIMQIELTNDCPFRCVMCPRTDNMTREIGMMSFGLFQKIIDELSAIHPEYAKTQPPVWLHHFGESLVHPEFAQFIQYAKTRGIPTAMSINPLMLTDRIADALLQAAPAALYISLDGHDDESFQQIRGIGKAYEKSKRRLQRFLDKKIQQGVGTHITLSVIDFVLNGHQGDAQRIELENGWRATPGIDAFFWKPYGTFSGDIDRLNTLASPTDAVNLMRHYKDLFKVTCDFPWRRMVITWNGQVVPCCHDFDVKMPLGDVNTSTLQEIWNGEKMLALRQAFISGQVDNPVCRECEHRYKNNPRED